MSQQVIWAPWRMEFLTGPKPGGCVFCDLPAQVGKDRDNLILFRGEKAFVILNKYPYNNGHLMVVPNRHTADYSTITAEESAEMHVLAQRSMKALEKAYKPDGFNMGMNLGIAAGAGVKDHLHQHVVPRWVGDNNFMPAIGEVKAMPQHLFQSYDVLAEAMK